MVILPTWWLYTLRLSAILFALAFLRAGIHGLLGRPLVVARPGGTTRTVNGWMARVFGLLAFMFAGLLLMFAFLAPGN